MCEAKQGGALKGRGSVTKGGQEPITKAPADRGEEYGFYSKCIGESLES